MTRREEKRYQLARDVIRLSLNTLLVHLRFLDMALSRLRPVATELTAFVTDGYFEKIGVISPKSDDSNNYRYYSAWDINLRNALRFPGLPFLLHFSTESCIIPRGKRDLFQRKNHGRTRRGKKT